MMNTHATFGDFMQKEPSIAERRAMYQARRGLKELDFYIDFYVKNHYLNASDDEKQTFDKLLAYEDPDLLLFFLAQATPEDTAVAKLIDKIKMLKNSG